jgi:choline dehydrogenase
MKYDVVVIGAGSAGTVLATRLSEDLDCSVLLLEAGPDYPVFEQIPDEIKYGFNTGAAPSSLRTLGGHPIALRNSQHNWQYTATSTALAPPMSVPRGKVTGGSSSINSSAFYRGIPDDFDGWAALGNDLWSFEQLLPYFRKIETDVDQQGDYHGTDGPIFVHHADSEQLHPAQTAFYSACRSLGFPDCPDHNSPDATGVGPSITNNHNGVRFSAALGHLSQARHRLNLTIKANCVARRILFDESRAYGVLVESGGDTFVVEGNQIVLSAGAIGSPQLLMLSGVGPEDHLRELGIPVVRDSPGVGQNLRDHPKVYLTWRVNEAYSGPAGPARGGFSLRFTAPDSQHRNDLSISMSAFVTERISGDDPGVGAEAHLPDTSRIEMMIALLLPLSSGGMRLASAEPDVQPLLDYNYLAESRDRERLRWGVRTALMLSKTNDLSPLFGERLGPTDADLESDEALDRWLMREAVTYSHICGTCKMGPATDPMAVVDQEGSVYGLDGLRVVDASIMPNLVRAPINPTVLAIGERISDLMRP